MQENLHESQSEFIELSVERMASSGRGIAVHNGETFFIQGTVPGDQVLVEAMPSRGRYRDARIRSWISRSADRKTHPCAHHQQCGGCPWLDVDPDQQMEWKRAALVSNLERNSGLDRWPSIGTMQGDQLAGTRQRLRLRGVSYQGRLEWGYLAAGTRDFIAIDTCLLAESAIRDLIKSLPRESSLPDMRFQLEVQAVNQDEQRAVIGMVLRDGPIEVAGLDSIRDVLKKTGFFAFVGHVLEERSKHFFPVDQVGDLRFFTQAGSFQQAHYLLNRSLRQRVLETIEHHVPQPQVILDLYCGSGNFTLALAKKFPKARVIGIEGSGPSLDNGRFSAEEAGITNITWHKGKVENQVRKARREGESCDVIIADPARDGMGRWSGVLRELEAKVLVYVSCDPQSFAADTRYLTRKQGFVLRQLTAVDMFPGTHHVETIAVFCPPSIP
ncbi:23S rRNA (uracil(1939)-C(5))-methyltransferase RlmD [Pseudobacteriovorax antillogorgiicola]|uniref:23S rRNA m(5)U-1939 methyltransferase n=1 Tax=Pseudobacteriovorax antillogorgiicola TaxID=1513793 RepID=A0A1Y6BT34_9BACT|nr:23S rRNA (uracil(1939)-C(5))-methyltransferase RlmD [Pseudobacteriovorax antillogorgiicola]TCS52955.1 23S rRNA m(5)U-1939 methyltransferase [Pseudobacteriovorax antillogorgiicola]SMF27624.1 23S rRNA m(5)U-1939 methyltransferase [Pseudobacteriovorax antillogorgiicola]